MTTTISSGTAGIPTSVCLELCRSAPVARVGFVVDGRPEVLPYSFRLVDRGPAGASVVLRTSPEGGLARAAGQVCLEIDEIDHASASAWSVVLHGTIRPPHPGEWLPDPDPSAADDQLAWRVVDIDDLAGRRFVAHPAGRMTGYSVEWQVT